MGLTKFLTNFLRISHSFMKLKIYFDVLRLNPSNFTFKMINFLTHDPFKKNIFMSHVMTLLEK